MNAVVLVGGGGTRLRPLTYSLPKPLLPVLNKPMLVHLLLALKSSGVTKVVLAATATEPRIEAALGDGSGLGLDIVYSYETEPLGSGLAVKQAAESLAERFFVCNGDVLTNLDLGAMLERHLNQKATMSVSLTWVGDPSSFGIAETEPEGRITRFIEKPSPGQTQSRLANAGTWIFEPEVLELIPDQKMDGSIERLVMPLLISQDQLVLGYPSEAYWMDAGTPERYLKLHQDLLDGAIPEWLDAETSSAGSQPALGGSLIGDSCKIGVDAQVIGRSVLGNQCVLAAKSLVEASVLWDAVEVGSEAEIRNSIVGKECAIGPGSRISGTVLANGVRVGANVQLTPGTRLDPGEVAS